MDAYRDQAERIVELEAELSKAIKMLKEDTLLRKAEAAMAEKGEDLALCKKSRDAFEDCTKELKQERDSAQAQLAEKEKELANAYALLRKEREIYSAHVARLNRELDEAINYGIVTRGEWAAVTEMASKVDEELAEKDRQIEKLREAGLVICEALDATTKPAQEPKP